MSSSSLEQLSLKKGGTFENCLCHGTDCFVKLKQVHKHYKMGSNLFFNLTRYRKVFLTFSSYLQLCFLCLVQQILKHLFCLNIVLTNEMSLDQIIDNFHEGQLIPKCPFGVFNSSKKRTKTIRPEVP